VVRGRLWSKEVEAEKESLSSCSKLNVGCFKRVKDAICFYVGLEARNWIAGISYDVISNDLNSTYNSV